MHTSAVGNVSIATFFSFGGGSECSTFLYVDGEDWFLDDFFKIILFLRTFQMEKEKSTDRQRSDKKIEKDTRKVTLDIESL
jgi:hypothetical protein